MANCTGGLTSILLSFCRPSRRLSRPLRGFPARLEALSLLQKTFFSGGTVITATPDEHYHYWLPSPSARFEDGSLPWLNIMALRYGFEALGELGMDAIGKSGQRPRRAHAPSSRGAETERVLRRAGRAEGS